MSENTVTDDHPPFVIVGGLTETATIEGISAAGASPELMVHTPSADFEIVQYGQPRQSPVVPVSPTGCPTPAVITRAVVECCSLDPTFVNAGFTKPTAVETVEIGDQPGRDIREAVAVPNAEELFNRAREQAPTIAGEAETDELVLAETIPGGTTTALGVLTALGERPSVSSSLPENPLSLKRETVRAGLEASGLEAGEVAGEPIQAVRQMGDPMLATVAGLIVGATEADISVTLGGGTQLAAAAALARHAGVTADIDLATTVFVADDETAGIHTLATDLDLSLTVTDPEFDGHDHPAMAGYVAGEAKEGVGMGGALALAARTGLSMEVVREHCRTVYDQLVEAPGDNAH